MKTKLFHHAAQKAPPKRPPVAPTMIPKAAPPRRNARRTTAKDLQQRFDDATRGLKRKLDHVAAAFAATPRTRRDFFKAIEEGDTAAVENVLKILPQAAKWFDAGKPVNGALTPWTTYKSCALETALNHGSFAVADLLIKADPTVMHMRTSLGTPLVFAQASNADRVRYFIENGMDANTADDHGTTLLMRAIWNDPDTEGFIKFMQSRGVDINVRDNQGHTVLDQVLDTHWTLYGQIDRGIVKHLDMALALLEAGAVTTKDAEHLQKIRDHAGRHGHASFNGFFEVREKQARLEKYLKDSAELRSTYAAGANLEANKPAVVRFKLG